MATTISDYAEKANVAVQDLPTNSRKSALCNFATHQEIISRILLGQSLLKNNNIFNNEMLSELQRENSHLHEIISQIEQDNNANNHFIIRNKVLYKIKNLGGTRIYKLCLPEDITFEILTRLHVNENLHLSASQTAEMFAMNFYSPQLHQISKSVN